MKKNLLILGYALSLTLLGIEANAQINYTQGFEGTHNWTAAEFFTTTEVPCEGLQSLVSDLHGGFVPNGSDATVSPSLGTSDGSLLTFSYNYKLVNSFDPGQPVLNSSDWGSFTVSWGTSASGPWTPIETINTTNHVQSLNCVERTATFTPANGSQVFIRVNTVLNNFSNFIKIYFDDITAMQVTPAMDYVNLQWPPTMDLNFGQTGTVYAQAYEQGLTEAAGQGAGVTAWIGISGENTNPATWTTWIPATFNVQAGNNDEYMATIGTGLQDGTYYYASRFQLNGGSYTYGGTNGIWNGTTNISGVLTVTCTTAAPTADTTQMVCAGSTLAELEVEGDQILWYTAATEGFPMSEMTELSDGGIYYAAQIPENGCESNARTAITVDLIVTPVPTGDATQEFTNNDTMPIVRPFSDLNIETSESAIVKWYLTLEDAQNGENGLTEDDGFAQSGTYYVTQTIGGCESEPFAVTVDVILGSEDFAAGSLKYYPNPVKDTFTMSFEGQITSVVVYNMLGQEVLIRQVNSTHAVINVSTLQAGTYIVKIATADSVKAIKIAKQ